MPHDEEQQKLLELSINVKNLKEVISRIEAKLDSLAIESRLAVMENRMNIVYGVLAALGLGVITLAVEILKGGP